MRRYPLTWFCVLLLLAAGVFLYLRQSHTLRNGGSSGSQAARARSAATASASAGAAKAAAASAATNKFAWRLSNTTNSLARLMHNPHAILLENAFIDTASKVNLSIPKNLQSQGDPGAYLVQARGPVNAAFRAALAAAGATIVSYIPNNSYLVRASEGVADGLMANPLVQAVLPYEPYYKVQASLLPMAQESLPSEEQLNLGLFADNAADTIQQIQQLGGIILSEENSAAGYAIVKVEPPADWTAIAQLPGVHIVEPYYHRKLANDLARTTLKISASSIAQTNYMNLYGSNVVIEINDGGIDTNHPDFRNGGSQDRFIYSDPGMSIDTGGHGTHVAGIIAGDGFESPTVTNAPGSPTPGWPGTNGQYRGKAPFAQMLSMNFQDSDQYLQAAAAETNALISNNSWDNGDQDYDLEAANYDAATRDSLPLVTGSQPVLYVFAAGDSGGSADSIESPGTAKDVMTVGALEENREITNLVSLITGSPGNYTTNISEPWLGETDDSNTVAAFSSDGNVGIGVEGTYGRFKPDVVAPGTFVVSCRSEQWNTNAYYHPTNDNFYDFPDLIPTGSVSTTTFSFQVPTNAVEVIIQAVTNLSSPTVLPPIPIYLQTNNPTTPFGYVGSNYVEISPSPETLNELWSVVASNVTDSPLPYDLIVNVLWTNWMGNYYQVLQGMNDGLGPPGNWYRYETGTSMSAPAISGFLALIQDYFTNQFEPRFIPSPALLKAMAINGSRPTLGYNVQVNNTMNFEGWGLPNMSNSIPGTLTNLPWPGELQTPGPSCSTFIRDQALTPFSQPFPGVAPTPSGPIKSGLATGDQETFMVQLNTNNASPGYLLPLRATLAWTDPPGDPSAAIKLVNSLELVVTDMDNPSIVYYGNDIGSSGYNNVENATNAPVVDAINNIQNIVIRPFSTNRFPDSLYSVTVIGNRVNVNAVSQETNDDVQDFALVISSGDMGEIPNGISSVTDDGIASNPTGDENDTIAHTNTILMNQTVGANTPLLGTNVVGFTTNTVAYSTNGEFTIGMTNQWHFYVVTNNTTFTNAAFITFGAETLSIPRMGVFANTLENATTPGADLDLLVTRSTTDANASNLMILDPIEVSNCVNELHGDGASLVSGGTDYVAYTNVVPGEVYYIGVKSESHMGVEYDFVPIFTDVPFGSLDQNGNEYVNAINVPSVIPEGINSRPGVSYVFLLALYPIEIQNVILTNTILHQNFGDLVGTISHNNVAVGLNSHKSLGNPPGPYTFIYDGYGTNDTPGSIPPSGPGSLQNYDGTAGQGIWQLTEESTALSQTGVVLNSQMFLQKYQDPRHGVYITVQPGQWGYTYLDVPDGYTNMQLFGSISNVITPAADEVQMYLNTGGFPSATTYLFETNLDNTTVPPAPFPYLGGQWSIISDGPPLAAERYYIGIFNANSVAETVYIQVQLNGPGTPAQPQLFTATNVVPIINDAVTVSTNTTMFISNTNTISSLNVGVVVQYPRISDLAFTLISPEGQRILLMENRGGPSATNAGGVFYITNSIGTTTANGSFEPQTNSYDLHNNSGSLAVFFNAYTIPDQLTIYYGTDPTTFNATSGDQLFNSGMMSGTTNITVTFGPGASTYVTFVVNQFGNTNTGGSDAWTYTINGTFPSYNYLTFTENSNLTVTPIKFAIPPFDLRDMGTNYTFGNLDLDTPGDYFSVTNISDPFGGWTVPTNLVTQVTNGVVFTNNYNEVSIVSDPAIAFQSNTNSSNFLALGYGLLQRTNILEPNHLVTVSYQYRGPGIAGWWRGEGDGRDSSDAEQRGQNGSLIGRFSFPAGEVSQSFAMENNGQEYDFAGTNSYVQIRQQPFYEEVVTNSSTNLESGGLVTIQSSYLDVGTGPGMTVEGWINPTNVSCQQPLVEWLARVPTNGSDTNLTIRAGPFLDRATDHYYYLLGPTNWTTSETWAEQLGGHLVTLDSADEGNWVFDTFASYGGKNRNLWIGLTNDIVNQVNNFAYSSGLTNLAYTNWLFMQPTNCDEPPSQNYAFMLGITNEYAGLWALADNNGIMCGPVTNIMYGVVEVTNLQTNGVQFWISVTNVPGTTNLIMTNSGCLFANLVDITNGSHWIYSGPNLIQSNVFQHVALTYDTNSGTAMLFYDGTNVATTNWGVNIVPKTTGDVLLGKDMSLETNNYFGGLMDEMSIYNRALSDAEIAAIYSVSAYTTNRLIGKFDPAVTPPLSLAEAQVVFGNMTNVILGENNTWQEGDFTFYAQTNAYPMQIQGIEPGMLLDSFGISEAPLGNLYFQPEQTLDELNGQAANGNWTLEIWDTRNNVLATNVNLLSWQLQMNLESNTPPPVSIGSQEPTTVTILPGQTVDLTITAPFWATEATNILDSSTEPLNVYFNQSAPPAGSSPPDTLLFGPTTTGSATLYTNAPALPPYFIPGQTYYIGLQNTGPHAASAVFEVDFNITALTNGVPYNDTLATNGSIRYFSFDVTSTNAYEATFQLLHMNGNADLVVSKGTPLPTLTSSDYGSFNSGNADENIYVLTNSAPVPLTPGTWYLGVFNRESRAVNYTVEAQELDLSSTSTTNMTLIQLTNGVPFNWTAGPGAALTNFFYFDVTNPVTLNTNGVFVTNYVGSIHFELYNLTGNGDLTVQTNEPPFAPPFFQSSDEPGTIPQFIQIQTNSALTNLAATWYLGVPNNTPNLIHYTIIAVIDTNSVFPAFPGAEGAGAGTPGASWRNGSTNNTVYHVVNLNDSGPGSLRDAVSSTNRTVIFDISGVIYLQTPLVISNPNLTILGQTAPEGGITVADSPVVVSTHDVVIRYIRMRPNFTAPTPDLYFGNYYAENIINLAPSGPVTVASNLNYPTGLAFDKAGDLFESDQFSGNIYEWPAGGGAQVTVATLAGGLQPSQIVINSAGDLFVNISDGSIYEYEPQPGGTFTQSTFVSGLNGSGGLAMDKEGNLYVGVSDNGGSILEITPNGVETTYASNLNVPSAGLAFDLSGNLYTTHSSGSGITDYITEITPGKVVTTFNSNMSNPGAMVVNQADDLVVADQAPNPDQGDIPTIAPNGSVISDNTAPYVNHPVSVTYPYGPATSIIQGGLGGDAFQFNTASNVIADHISALWSSNDDLSILSSSNVTVQWSILSDSISNQPAANGALVRYGSGTVSLHHNLFADNYTGSPRLGDNVSLDFVNNVIYNWETNAGYSSSDDITNDTVGFTNRLNYICNYLIAGPNTITTNIAFWGGTNSTWLFQTNNLIDNNADGVLNGASAEWNMFTNWNNFTNLYTATNQFRLPPVSVDEAYMAYEKVLDFAGVSMFRREPAETNIVENVRRQTGGIVTAPGVLPTLSTNLIFQYNAQDGIPDFWKLTFGQIVTNQYNNHLPDSSGYSELEEFDNWLAGPHALTVTNAPVGVDLEKLFGKTGSLSFWLTNAIHGTVYLTNVLGAYTNQGEFSNSIAIFTPTNEPGGSNYSGFASFDVDVTNNDTVGYFGPVTVNVFVSGVHPTYSEQAGYLTQNVPMTNSVPPYTTIWYLISVPTNAIEATNTLLSAGAPMNLLYSSNQPPTTAYPSDLALLTDSTNGSVVINPSGAPVPAQLVPGGLYYLGVQNTNNFATNYVVQVSFETISLPPGVIIINPGQPIIIILPPGASAGGASPGGASLTTTNNPFQFGVYVPPNAVSATNTLSGTSGSVSLWFNQTTTPLPQTSGDYELIANYAGTSPTNAVLSLSSTPPLDPGQVYYLAVTNSSSETVTDTFAVNFGLSYSPPVLPTVTNITIVAGNTLNVNDQASDTNYGTLVYYLATVPNVTNAFISDSGQITWAVPTNFPGENVLFTTIVSNSYTLVTATNEFTVTVIPLATPNGPPQTNSVPPNTVNWIAVPVPVDAEWATNILLYATNLPVNVLFTTNSPPLTNGAYTLMFAETNGTSVLGTQTVPTNIVPGSIYYVGVQNTNISTVNYAIQFAFGYYSPPSLPSVSNQVIVAGTTLTVNNHATDTNGVGQLFYTLTTAPPVNATISGTGLITWPTTTNQAPGEYVFTTVVTNSVTTLGDTNTFTVTVVAPVVGHQPQTNSVPANSVAWMTVNVPANAEWATNILLFAHNLPVNVLYNSSPTVNGASALLSHVTRGSSILFTNLSTAPTNLVPGGTYYLGVQNTNNAAVTYALEVNFGYPPGPVHVSIIYTNIGGTNGYLLTWFAQTNNYFQVQQSPGLAAPDWNTFTNIITYTGPATPTNGMFSFFDNGVEYPFGPIRFYRLLLLQANGLVLPNQSNYVVSVSELLVVTNTAVDSGTNVTLTYFLTDFPSPATSPLISTNGIISWTPGPADAGNAFTFTTFVSDNGLPPAATSNAFTVFVLPAPVITNAVATPNGVTVQWSASANDVFEVEWTTNLVSGNWAILPQVVTSSTGSFSFTDTDPALAVKFYRLVWIPPL